MTKAPLMLAAAIALGAGACKKSSDTLLLLEVRTSGPLVAPVASIRLSVPDHATWAVHVVNADLGAGSLKVGYYVPGGAGPVTVRAEALDDNSCVLGDGTLTFPATAGGATSQPMTMFVRPFPSSGCRDASAPDAMSSDASDANPPTDGSSADTASPDDASDGGSADGASDSALDGSTDDGGVDAPAEANPPPDAATDAAPDAAPDVAPDA